MLARANHPVGIVTKSALVTRDIDILGPMAERGLAKVALSVTTLDPKLARTMEPRAARPASASTPSASFRRRAFPTTVMVAPIIPGRERPGDRGDPGRGAPAAGRREAGYVLLRLPLEVRDLFREWLLEHHPGQAAPRAVADEIHARRQGLRCKWGERMTGDGPYAWMIGRRFEIAAKRLGFNKDRRKLRTDLFTPPVQPGEQLKLF